MANYVLTIDCSSSIRKALTEIKNDVINEWIPWRLSHEGPNNLALVAFGSDVYIKSHFTNNLQDITGLVASLYNGCCGGYMTSLYDAIIVSLLFEDPKPNGITVWTDGNDTRSNASLNEYEILASSLNVPIDFPEIPEHWWDEDAITWANYYKPILGETIFLRKEYIASMGKITKNVKKARVISDP